MRDVLVGEGLLKDLIDFSLRVATFFALLVLFISMGGEIGVLATDLVLLRSASAHCIVVVGFATKSLIPAQHIVDDVEIRQGLKLRRCEIASFLPAR